MYHRIGKNGEKYWGKTGAGILFTDGKKILLLKRAETDHKDTWGMPGGKCEMGESASAASIRETKEECGIAHVPGVRIDTLAQRDGHHSWTTFVYRVGEPFKDLSLSNEHSDWKWFDLSDLPSTNLHPKFKQQLPRYLSVIRNKFPRDFKEWKKLRDLNY
jgi:8-oxo-dGTP diphosphatase